MIWCNTSSSILGNATLAALCCSDSAPPGVTCDVICPNPDISGVGVRIAFYVQSFLNTLLVIFSRRDSVPSTWATTLLTGALVIAAMVQKRAQAITLHHAILTLNFATLSCISSLAVAPTLSVWRLTPREYYVKRLARDILDDDEDHQDRIVGTAVDALTGRNKKRIARAQSRQRLFLAIALLTQVVLQWAWGIVLFVSPAYSQRSCSGGTRLIFFLAPFTADTINERLMVVWVFWLLFSLGITLFMTIVLALTSPSRARPWTVRSSPVSSITTREGTGSTPGSFASRPIYEQFYISAKAAVPSWKDKAGQLVFAYNAISVVLWLVYIISSEIQIQANCLFEGENDVTSFGQITALLLSLAPLWSLIGALYKWPEMQRKLERRRRREQQRMQSMRSRDSSVGPHTRTAVSLDDVAIDVDVDVDVDTDAAVPRHLKGPGADTADVHTFEVVSAVPARDRAQPVAALSRLRIGRPRGARAARQTHVRFPTLEGVYIARTSTQEWVELEGVFRDGRGS